MKPSARVAWTMLAVALLLLAGTSGSAQRPGGDTPPTVTGKVAAYDAGKFITVEVKKRNEPVTQHQFAIVKDKTKVELLGETKAIAVGVPVQVWADKDNPKVAARIVAGTPKKRDLPPSKDPPPAKKDENKQPDPPPVK